MNLLTIESENGQRRELRFLGWRDDGLAFYATTADGQAAVVTLQAPYPDDCYTCEPYRFPKMVPLSIKPKRFELAWSERHFGVLRRWLDAKLAEVDAMPDDELFFSDALKNPRPSRSPEEFQRRRAEKKEQWRSYYKILVETPLDELLDPISYGGLLREFISGKWAEDMGEDYLSMISDADRFNDLYQQALSPDEQHTDYRGMAGSLLGVRFEMEGDDGQKYYLYGFAERPPIDEKEALGYSALHGLLRATAEPGASAASADNPLCAEVRLGAGFPDGSLVGSADCPRRDPILDEKQHRLIESPASISEPTGQAPYSAHLRNQDITAFLALPEALTKAGQQARAEVEAGAARLEERTTSLARERQKLEAVPGKLAAEGQSIEAATNQLTAKTQALDDVISPINRLYSVVELAEIRRLAHGEGVPDLFADWVLMEFQRSSPARLPTKGCAFENCGPGTLIGKRLSQAGIGISKQRLADHLTAIRRLLVRKGWLADPNSPQSPLDTGKTRKRESSFQPDDRLEDHTQPTPAEAAEDRDAERQ